MGNIKRIISSEPLPQTIQAIVLEKSEKLTCKEIPLWPLLDYNDDELVLVKVKSCGLCGSDLRYYLGENPWGQHTLGKYIPNPPNIVLGHEFSGEIVAVINPGLRELLGKRVAPICSKVCGHCFYCKHGMENLCPETVHIGHGQGWGERDYFPGAYAEYVPVWAKSCYEISDSMPWETAAMMDLLAVGCHVARRGNIKPEMPIMIIGAGPVGNSIIQVANILGAGRVIVLDQAEIPLTLAAKAGADFILDSRELSHSEIIDLVLRTTDEVLPASIFDTVGTKKSFDLGIRLLGKAGTYVNVAVHDLNLDVNSMSIASEKTITSSCNFDAIDYEDTLRWLEEGRIKVDDWIHRISLQDVPYIFPRLIQDQKKDIFKVCINF